MNLSEKAYPPDLSAIYDERLANQLANTQGAISSLNQKAQSLHNPLLLMRPILGKEAESSSQLEGTQASIEDAYQIDITEQTPEKRDHAIEIRNYENAMLKGLDMIRKTDFKNIVVREVHKELMQGARGKDKGPGELRTTEVWLGNRGSTKEEARYVPPDALQVPPLMEQFENLLKNRGSLHPLIACSVLHHRFEAIHPFADGNGRTGRLLISLYLIKEGLIDLPILYPSGYFEKDKDAYMDSLAGVDREEKWYPWIMYLLEGLEKQANTSLVVSKEIYDLFQTSRSSIENERAGLNLIRVLEHTFTQPYLTAAIVKSSLGIPKTTSARYLTVLESKKVIERVGIFRREAVYVNLKLLAILRSI